MLDSTDTADITNTSVHVAIIDDSRADARFLERLMTNLSGWKIDVTIYDSPDEAFIHLKESPPDVLIIDYLLGLRFEHPLGNRAAEAELRRARLERSQAVLAYRATVQSIVLDVKRALGKFYGWLLGRRPDSFAASNVE